MLKVAIIGAGGISSAHIEAYLTFKDRCEIVAVCDVYEEKAVSQIARFGLDAKSYKNYEDILQEDIDLVSICTPPYTHAKLAIDFMLANKHVIVEKPMAASLEECDAMNKTSAQTGKVLSVIAQNRFKTPMMKLKAMLEQQLIGKLVHIQVDSFWWRGHCYYDLWWRGTWEKEGGGPTLNHAVHHIDAMLWMSGMPNEVQAIMTNVSHDNAEVEDLSITLLRYNTGALGQVTSSVVHHGEEQQLIFQGEKARISVPWKVRASMSTSNGFPEQNVELENELNAAYDSLPEVVYDGHTGQIDNVLTAIEQGTPVLIDGISGRQTLELITAIYKSASTGQAVSLPLQEKDAFYTREGIQAHATHFYEKSQSVENFQETKITLGRDYTK